MDGVVDQLDQLISHGQHRALCDVGWGNSSALSHDLVDLTRKGPDGAIDGSVSFSKLSLAGLVHGLTPDTARNP